MLLAGLIGSIQLGNAGGWQGSYDPTRLTAPFGFLGNAVVAPLARWDSVWYLTVARNGYAHNRERMAFFPLYPALMHVLSWVVRSDLVAGALISLGALIVALVLIQRLVRLDFDDEVAATTVLL
ncbi:MAG: mannosyltransferase family protein, partial [Trebonia sp.]